MAKLNKAQHNRFNKKFQNKKDGWREFWNLPPQEVKEIKQHLADELAREYEKGYRKGQRDADRDYGTGEKIMTNALLKKQKKELVGKFEKMKKEHYQNCKNGLDSGDYAICDCGVGTWNKAIDQAIRITK